ncbi:ankyrin repeat-containing protein NPR4-like [Salvia splendens]|uniref:ankyrin repeat-containing protein NPR4-like n=1 Tax=Salvia splendens TaxID=180675 RepID=UPI001C26D8F5|nr:ankyrin repeat-containing protein NPR4-like [Salvia splendens]
MFLIVAISVPGINRFHEKKLMREQIVELVKSLCKHMESLDYNDAAAICAETMLTAAESGSHDVVLEIVETFPLAVHFRNSLDQNFLHLAIKNRCENVFNLMYMTSMCRYQYANAIDNDGNSILHLAARLAPFHKLNLVSGAALQMQREIQWFQEASKFVSSYTRGLQNYSGETAEMIFTEEHRELKIDGETWMKDTANSCSIAAALIVTVVFAAAITVPGGNQSDSGYPILYESSAFTIFAVSDAVSLFTSSTSLLMFLSILTSRYAEHDFLYALPKRLSIGLVTLFLSILFMMIAFSSTLYLVFGRKKAWVLLPVGALTCLPISSFVLSQFPLLRDVISSTYGRGVFGKRSNRTRTFP